MGPDQKIIHQGEVQRSIHYFDLTYSIVKAPMRIALATETLHAQGLRAVHILKSAMDATSWDNLNRLFDQFPDSVIEYTTYSIPVGELGNNTVIWEVRNY